MLPDQRVKQIAGRLRHLHGGGGKGEGLRSIARHRRIRHTIRDANDRVAIVMGGQRCRSGPSPHAVHANVESARTHIGCIRRVASFKFINAPSGLGRDLVLREIRLVPSPPRLSASRASLRRWSHSRVFHSPKTRTNHQECHELNPSRSMKMPTRFNVISLPPSPPIRRPFYAGRMREAGSIRTEG